MSVYPSLLIALVVLASTCQADKSEMDKITQEEVQSLPTELQPCPMVASGVAYASSSGAMDPDQPVSSSSSDQQANVGGGTVSIQPYPLPTVIDDTSGGQTTPGYNPDKDSAVKPGAVSGSDGDDDDPSGQEDSQETKPPIDANMPEPIPCTYKPGVIEPYPIDAPDGGSTSSGGTTSIEDTDGDGIGDVITTTPGSGSEGSGGEAEKPGSTESNPGYPGSDSPEDQPIIAVDLISDFVRVTEDPVTGEMVPISATEAATVDESVEKSAVVEDALAPAPGPASEAAPVSGAGNHRAAGGAISYLSGLLLLLLVLL